MRVWGVNCEHLPISYAFHSRIDIILTVHLFVVYWIFFLHDMSIINFYQICLSNVSIFPVSLYIAFQFWTSNPSIHLIHMILLLNYCELLWFWKSSIEMGTSGLDIHDSNITGCDNGGEFVNENLLHSISVGLIFWMHIDELCLNLNSIVCLLIIVHSIFYLIFIIKLCIQWINQWFNSTNSTAFRRCVCIYFSNSYWRCILSFKIDLLGYNSIWNIIQWK